MKNPLTKVRCQQIIRLFDYCYKRGVLDGDEACDDFLASEWLSERMSKFDFGLLSDIDIEYDWKRWRYTLMRWCRICGLRPLGEEIIDNIRNKNNFIYAIFPFSMRFYLMGLQEWLAYPNGANIEYFKHNAKIRWKAERGKQYKAMRNGDYIVYLQQFTYEAQDSAASTTPVSFLDDFTQAIWRGLRE